MKRVISVFLAMLMVCVLCITTNEEFDSICAAARYYNIPQANISYCLQGKRKSAGKHPVTKEKMIWKYL